MSSSRRDFLWHTLGGVGALALLDACSSSDVSDTGVDAATGTGTDGNSGTITDGGTVDSSGFATGDGSFLSGKDYGNPFTTTATACTVYTASTAGPCHSNTYNRKDITDGLVGLPTRIELLVTNTSCAPVAGAIVEIWYASPVGTYSKAPTAESGGTYSGSLSDLNVSFCTGNNAEALANNWLRGYQTTGADGRVTFDGIFPGWYSGRTTHIHFTVAINGTKTDTSQIMFDETLTTAIYTQHATYSPHGNKDTTNAHDNVITGGLPIATALAGYAQQTDGAIVVWKQITVNA